jgi:hypothetical protein
MNRRAGRGVERGPPLPLPNAGRPLVSPGYWSQVEDLTIVVSPALDAKRPGKARKADRSQVDLGTYVELLDPSELVDIVME